MKSTTAVVAVIPAAGIGSRMQADKPKQYLLLAGKTILEHTVDQLLSHPAIERAVIAISPEDHYFYSLPLASNPNIHVVEGGKERADSVLNALNTLDDNTWAMVHDAARPCVKHDDITQLLEVMHNTTVSGGILATPVRDTMKRADTASTTISHTESREHLWHALTPQLFPTQALRGALTRALSAKALVTDESSAMEWDNKAVALIDSDPVNIKITHPADLPLAGFYLQQQKKAVVCE